MTEEKKPAKQNIIVTSLAQLRSVVDGLIATGRTDMKINFSAEMLLEEDAWKELERLTEHHPASKPVEEEEVVSYTADALDPQTWRGIPYIISPVAGGRYRMAVDQGCAGLMEPFDTDFADIGEADEHARGYIDGVIERAEREAARIKAKRADDQAGYDTSST